MKPPKPTQQLGVQSRLDVERAFAIHEHPQAFPGDPGFVDGRMAEDDESGIAVTRAITELISLKDDGCNAALV